MGAEDFTAEGKGKTLEAAFRRAHDAATWEYGHGGYTGTIAEKGYAIEFPLPEGVSAWDFARAAWSSQECYEFDSATQKMVLRPGKTPEWVKDGSYPLETWRRVVSTAEDKWGPACAVRIGPDEFFFFGLASY